MASTCGSTLSLMDAGVPIKAPVAGAAMGLITDPATGRYAVLTDITGKEDAYGDMDFKVAGTADGVTALQMDIKVAGITSETLRDALEQARQARLHILDKMTEVISASRSELSPYAPRITTIKIPVDKIRDVIGAGGKVIRQITAETGTQINVEDDGTIQIAATDGEAAKKAIAWIEGLTKDVEVGKEYLGKVTRIMNFGAFVEILPGKEGLVHISQLADYRVPRVEDVVSIGDELMVVVTEIDRMGRVNLSRRAAMERHMAKAGVADGQRRRIGPLGLLTDAAAAATRRRSRPLWRREAARPMGAETVLTAVASEVRACTRCPLHRGRTQAVPGEGNPSQRRAAGGRGSRRPRGRHRAAVRGAGRPAAERAARRAGLGARGRLHRQRGEVPPAGQPRPGAGGDRGLLRLPGPTGGRARAGGDRDAGPALAAALPARRAHLRACTASCADRAAASSSRCTILLPRCTRPRCGRRSSPTFVGCRQRCWPLARRSRPNGWHRSRKRLPSRSPSWCRAPMTEQMTLFQEPR